MRDDPFWTYLESQWDSEVRSAEPEPAEASAVGAALPSRGPRRPRTVLRPKREGYVTTDHDSPVDAMPHAMRPSVNAAAWTPVARPLPAEAFDIEASPWPRFIVGGLCAGIVAATLLSGASVRVTDQLRATWASFETAVGSARHR